MILNPLDLGIEIALRVFGRESCFEIGDRRFLDRLARDRALEVVAILSSP